MIFLGVQDILFYFQSKGTRFVLHYHFFILDRYNNSHVFLKTCIYKK